ncbi:uncharacterized protein F4822DRAFT_319481 [Hypoxylon trugodes]|uniref:uncharacterized protein n=1 Tax=Hypoxylon trugodes TaxID=326681 RepID=UPI00219644B0|nr:uncharacterized protein F4822DRAFT_319481 [Hypoxylon trugodes]KAI1386534.1 hypothetical protein F4822DRAFT_319481 [Hypoxylon trugodes]
MVSLCFISLYLSTTPRMAMLLCFSEALRKPRVYGTIARQSVASLRVSAFSITEKARIPSVQLVLSRKMASSIVACICL